jgi:site-specific recombinase XerD
MSIKAQEHLHSTMSIQIDQLNWRVAGPEIGPELLRNLAGRGTLANCEVAWNHYKAFCGQHGIEPMQRTSLVAWRSELVGDDPKQGLSPVSIGSKLSAIRSIAKAAADHGLLPYDVAQSIASVENPKVLPLRARLANRKSHLSQAQVRRLIDACGPESEVKGLRDRAMLSVMFSAGVRVQELCTITVEDVVKVPGTGQSVLMVQGKRDVQKRPVGVSRVAVALL